MARLCYPSRPLSTKGGAFNPSDRIKNKLVYALAPVLSDGSLSVDDIAERLHVPQDEILFLAWK